MCILFFSCTWFPSLIHDFCTAILYKEVKLRLKLIFDLKMRLVLWFEVFVGTPVLVEDARRCVAHNRILSFVRAFKDAEQRLQLLLIEARLWREKVIHSTDCKSNTLSTFWETMLPRWWGGWSGTRLELTVSEVRSAGSRDILATARVESLPTRALYGASFP